METEIDIEEFGSLRRYLTERGHLKPDESISFKRLLGGVSNRTVRVGWPDGHGWVLKQALAKLRVDVDWFSDPERIGVEAKATRWLNALAPKDTTPLFVFEDIANHLMAMEAIPEESESWKSVLLSGRIVSDHFEQFNFLEPFTDGRQRLAPKSPESSETPPISRVYDLIRTISTPQGKLLLPLGF